MSDIKLYPCFQHWLQNNNTQNNTIWLYSDPHFNDPEMVYLRSNYVGDDEQVKRINSKVGKNDTIIFLGDIGDLSLIKKIRGYKILIKGNHDSGINNYKRVENFEKVDVEKYLNGKMPNDLCFLSETKQENYYAEARKRALEDFKNRPNFIRINNLLTYDIQHAPFLYWYAYFDNKLFDEVYEGTLQISPKIMLSHEPVEYEYCLNIHGHDHSNWNRSTNHLNLCAEHINYTPVNLNNIIKQGLLKDIPDVHRETIDNATAKKLAKNK